MTYTSTKLGPEFTPGIVKKIIILTIGTSIFAALTNEIFRWLFSLPGPQEWLALSWWGLNHLFLWQPITFLFVQSTGIFGIDLSFLITLAFQMYLLWVMGAYINERLGRKPFLIIYFGSGITAGALTLLISGLFGYSPILAGAAPAVIGLAIIWMMLNPESEIWLFFVIPIKAKWLITGILAAILLINLSQLHLVNLLFYLSGAVFAYLYGIIAFELRSPFPITYDFEDWIRSWNFSRKAKIIRFETGEEESDDDRFVDEMLQKIAKSGESSLTWRERQRLDKISKKKAHRK